MVLAEFLALHASISEKASTPDQRRRMEQALVTYRGTEGATGSAVPTLAFPVPRKNKSSRTGKIAQRALCGAPDLAHSTTRARQAERAHPPARPAPVEAGQTPRRRAARLPPPRPTPPDEPTDGRGQVARMSRELPLEALPDYPPTRLAGRQPTLPVCPSARHPSIGVLRCRHPPFG